MGWIHIIAIHGSEHQVKKVDEAIEYIENYDIKNDPLELLKFEIYIRYNNGDKVEASFQNKEKAIDFLSTFK